MRTLIFIGFVALGALLAVLASMHDDWATRIVAMGVGGLFGAPLGAAIGSIGRKRLRSKAGGSDSDLSGTSTSPKDLSANYWRDKGHPPFMKPADAEPDLHMFDPDKLG